MITVTSDVVPLPTGYASELAAARGETAARGRGGEAGTDRGRRQGRRANLTEAEPTRTDGALAKPAILTVDGDPAVSQAITRDLRRQYGSEYQIVRVILRRRGTRGPDRVRDA